MNPIFQLRTRLQKHSGLTVDVGDSGLHIERPNANGFEIEIVWERSPDHWMVMFGDGPLHVHCSSSDEVVQLVEMALCDRCRLRVVWRGSWATSASLEYWDGNRWQMGHRTALLVYPFWRRRSDHVYQNQAIGHPPTPDMPQAVSR